MAWTSVDHYKRIYFLAQKIFFFRISTSPDPTRSRRNLQKKLTRPDPTRGSTSLVDITAMATNSNE